MRKPRVLDLFCGEGGASVGLARAGFDVTGVDIVRQKRYPFSFVQADACSPPFRLGDFDLVWASPPCQGYSRTRHLPWNKGREHPMLIPAMRDMLSREARLWVIENVEDAPLNGVALVGSMFGLPFRRLRRFESNFLIMAPCPGKIPVGLPGAMFGNRLKLQVKAIDLPHCTVAGRGQAIPPQYSEHIANYALMAMAVA